MTVIEIILQYASMWAPALVAVLGIVATVVLAINKVADAIAKFKEDDTLRGLAAKLKEVSDENRELIRCNKLLLDRITKIQGYADSKDKEG